MLSYVRVSLGAAVLVAGLVGASHAQTDVYAQRMEMMKSLAGGMGGLVGMAQGKVPFDAEKVRAAADAMSVSLTQDWAPLFPEGSDADSLGKGKSKPEIWANMDDFVAKQQRTAAAAEALASAAAGGPEALRPAIGQMGAACSSCHELYRR